MIDNVKFIATSGLLIICIILMSFQKCENDNLKENNNLLIAANDTLRKKKNKDGSQTATIALLQASNVNKLLKLKTQDETIKALQEEVKKHRDKLDAGGSVTTFSTATTFSAVHQTDSTVLASTGCDSVIYSSNKDTTWVKYSIEARKDATRLNLKVKNAFTVVIGREKVGFLKYRPIVDVTSKNPFTDIGTLRAFEVKDTRPQRRISLGAQLGFGVLFKGQISTGFYTGIGLNFRIL